MSFVFNKRFQRAFLFFVLIACGSFYSTLIVHAEELVKAPLPSWANISTYDVKGVVSDTDNNFGREYVLSDSIVSYLGEESVTLERLVIKISSQSMAQFFSKMTISYAPAYQSYAVHTMTIWRDGKAINVIGKVKTTFMNQLTESTEAAHEGLSNVTIFVPNLKRGDIFEFAFSKTGQNKAFGNRAFGSLIDVPAGGLSYDIRRIIAFPEERQIIFNYQNDMPAAKHVVENGVSKYIWQSSKRSDDNTDAATFNFINPPRVSYSSVAEWGDIVTWAKGLFQTDMAVTRDIALLAKEITKTFESSEDKIKALLGYMQSNVRYVGMEIGRHGYIPFPPSAVLERGYGDCKDQTMMLISMLKAIGVKAWPSLVHSINGNDITPDFSSPLAFNHLIVHLEIDGRKYWLDPTLLLMDGTPVWLDSPDYGYALVVREGENALTEIDVSGLMYASLITHDYDFTSGLEGESFYAKKVVLRGKSAKDIRRNRENLGKEGAEQAILELMKSRYNDAEVIIPPMIRESQLENAVTIEESYKYHFEEMYMQDSKMSRFTFTPESLMAAFPKNSIELNGNASNLKFPHKSEENYSFKLNDNFEIEPSEIKIVSPYHSFLKSTYVDEGLFRIDYIYEILKKEVPNADIEQYEEEVEEIKENLTSTLYELDLDPDVSQKLTYSPTAYSRLYKGTARYEKFKAKLDNFFDEQDKINGSKFESYSILDQWRDLPKDSRIYIHWVLAKEFYYKDQYEEVLERITKVEEVATISSRGLVLKARVLFLLGKYEELIEVVKKLEGLSGINLSRTGRSALMSMVLESNLKLGNINEAKKVFDDFIQPSTKEFKEKDILSLRRKVITMGLADETIEQLSEMGLHFEDIPNYDEVFLFYRPEPIYPTVAIEKGINNGWVEVEIDVSIGGDVEACRLISQGPGEYFAAAACDAALGIKYLSAYDASAVEGIKLRYEFIYTGSDEGGTP